MSVYELSVVLVFFLDPRKVRHLNLEWNSLFLIKFFIPSAGQKEKQTSEKLRLMSVLQAVGDDRKRSTTFG